MRSIILSLVFAATASAQTLTTTERANLDRWFAAAAARVRLW